MTFCKSISIISLILICLVIYIWYLANIEYYHQILKFREIPDFTRWILSDKYVAKKYAKVLGFEVPQSYLLVRYPSQIVSGLQQNYPDLSNYVIKPVDLCDSGGVYLVKDNVDIRTNKPINLLEVSQELISLRSKIRDEYYMHEKMYSGLVPYTGYLVEELLLDKRGNIPGDYKCYVFGGKLCYTALTYNRRQVNRKQIFDSLWLDSEGNAIRIPMIKKRYQYTKIMLPQEYNKMKALVENAGKKLGRHCRIDVYLLDGKVYLGEFTFFCGAQLHTKIGNLMLGYKWYQNPDNYNQEDLRLKELVPEFYNFPY